MLHNTPRSFAIAQVDIKKDRRDEVKILAIGVGVMPTEAKCLVFQSWLIIERQVAARVGSSAEKRMFGWESSRSKRDLH